MTDMTDEEKILARKAQARDYYYNWGGKEYRHKYYMACREENRERKKAYYQAHREERLAYQRAYYARKKAEKSGKESDL